MFLLKLYYFIVFFYSVSFTTACILFSELSFSSSVSIVSAILETFAYILNGITVNSANILAITGPKINKNKPLILSSAP